MSKNKTRAVRLHLAKVAAKAERLGFEVPPEVRKELNMEKVRRLLSDSATTFGPASTGMVMHERCVRAVFPLKHWCARLPKRKGCPLLE
jgi:hypothetical protein